jgi:hypothetical protein
MCNDVASAALLEAYGENVCAAEQHTEECRLHSGSISTTTLLEIHKEGRCR